MTEYLSDVQLKLFLKNLDQDGSMFRADSTGIHFLSMVLIESTNDTSFKFAPIQQRLEILSDQLNKDFTSARENNLPEEFDRLWFAWMMLNSFRNGINFDQKRIRS